jgi:hypothetical protein
MPGQDANELHVHACYQRINAAAPFKQQRTEKLLALANLVGAASTQDKRGRTKKPGQQKGAKWSDAVTQ